MIRSELIALIATKQPHLPPSDVSAAVTLLINRMVDELASGGRIEIRGFGSFSLKQHKARLGRNPKTGESVMIVQKHAIHFKAGTELRARVNDSSAHYPIVD